MFLYKQMKEFEKCYQAETQGGEPIYRRLMIRSRRSPVKLLFLGGVGCQTKTEALTEELF